MLIVRENGREVERISRNDLKNTFSPKHHKPVYRPGYKGKWETQMQTNKGLLMAIGILVFIMLGVLVGSSLRVERYKAEIRALQHELDRTLTISEQNILDYNTLLIEYASCSAKLDESKLSSKARTHMKQQPIVAAKIKQHFGDNWVEAMELISRESSLNPAAINPSSLACGLFQSYPCEKMNCSLTDIDCQIEWGENYISTRYGTVLAALNSNIMRGWY